MATPYQPDHETEGLDELLVQLQNRDNIEGLIVGLIVPIQALEDDYLDLRTDQLLSASVGTQLDRWGRLVGEIRGTLADDDYRRFITARILANLSGGNADRLLEVLRLVAAPFTAGEVCVYRQLGGPAYLIAIYRDVALSATMAARVADILDDIRPAGVGAAIVESVAPAWRFDTAGHGFDLGLLGRLL